jgi:hypothetical protein
MLLYTPRALSTACRKNYINTKVTSYLKKVNDKIIKSEKIPPPRLDPSSAWNTPGRQRASLKILPDTGIRPVP